MIKKILAGLLICIAAIANNGSVAHIELHKDDKPSPIQNAVTLKLIERRHTDKRPYQNDAIAPKHLSALLAQHQPWLYPRNSAGFNKLVGYVVEAAKTQALNKNKREEFAQWLRFSNGEEMFAATIRSGMNLESFWLDAVQYGISIQPVSQMLEEDAFRKQLAQTLGLSQPPQMILRAGYVDDYGENNKIRRNISMFTSLESQPTVN